MDKKINVKITANTSKFKKAISDATKSLNNMKKSSDKISKSKIDKNLNKQFDNITKGSKKVDKQLQQNIKSLKDIAKSKLDKVVKQFDNMNKTVKNNNKTLQSLQKTLNSLKTKSIEAVNKALTSMSKGASTVSKSLSNVKNVLSSISTKTIEALTRSITTLNNKCPAVASGFTKIKDAINNISTKTIETVRASLDKIKDKCPAVSNGFTNIKNNINNIKSGVFSTLSSKLDAVKSKASDTGNKFKDLKSRISDTAKQTFQKLVDSTTRLNTEGTKSGNIFTNFGNKIKSLTGSALGGLSNKLNSLKGTTVSLNSSFAGTATKAVVAGTAIASSSKAVTTMANSNKQLATALGSSQKEVNKLGTAFNKLKLGTLNEKLPEVRSNILDLSNKVKKAAENYAKYTQQLSRAEEAMSKQRVLTDRQVEGLERLRKKQKDAEDELRNWEALLNSERDVESMLNAERDKAIQKIGKYSNAEKTATKSTKDNTKALNDAAKAEDKLKNNTEKASNSTKKLVSGTQTLRSATGNLREQLKGTAKATKEVSDAQTKAEKTTKSFSEKIKDLAKGLDEAFESEDFGSAFDGLKNAGKAAFALMPGYIKKTAALFVGLKKLYDLGKKNFFEGLNNIKNTLQPVINGFTSLVNGMKTAFTELTGFQFRLSALITVGANFEDQMKKVTTISAGVGSAAANINKTLTAKARELGASTRYSATQVGEAFEYMAMAGWSADEMLNGIQSTLDLATIGATDLGTASDILTDDLTALGLQANQAGDFADKLAATITNANTDVVGFGESMKQVGSIAGALGVDMTDLSTCIGLMANAGIKGSKAGMSLKNLLANMASPTEKQAKALKELNIEYNEQDGYLKTTKEGTIDLAATVKSLKKGMEGMTRAQKASYITAIAGKNALPGVMALLNATDKEFDELSGKIDDSTSTVHMFNQNMHDTGVIGEEAQERIDKMKDVFDETELSATSLGLSSKELGYAISLLGNDSKVSAGNVEQLLDVIESMDNATGKVDEFWRTIGNAKNVKIDGKYLNQLFDEDKTLQKIDDSTIGLSDHTIEYAKAHGQSVLMTKEYVKNKLKECKTLQQANDFLKQYDLTAEEVSFDSLSFADKVDYLRQTFRGCTEEQIKNKLATIGLADSYDEVYEIAHMNNEEYKKYKRNLEITEGAARRMAEAMDETTKAAFYGLSSAMEDSLIALFEKLKPAIMNATDALIEFFETWRNGDKNEYTFDGFEKGLSNLEKKVKSAIPNITEAITNAIKGIKRFVTGGSLDSILQIGTDIITGICQGIIKNKKDLTTAISEAIRKLCDWIHKNKAQVKEAGLTILEAIGDGISKNHDKIKTACDDIYEVINAWAAANDHNIYELGATVGWSFMKGFTIGGVQKGIGALGGVLDGLGGGEKGQKKTVDTFSATGGDFREQVKGKKGNSTNVAYAAEIDAAKKAGNKTVDVYKKTVRERLKDKLITENDAKEIEKALDRGEQAKKGAWKTTKAYISELQSQLASGDIDTKIFDAKLEKLSMVDKAKSAADKTSRAYYDSLEAALMSGDVDPSAVDSILSSLEASDAIYKTASDTGKTYLDALKQQLVSGQITPEEFNALVFSGNFEEAAKKYTETGKITAGDVIDAKSFSNVQEVNDLMDALDDLNEKYSKLSGTITDSCKKMADSTRSNFVGIANIVRNQMVNVANIVRNQMLNCTNITRNQFVNMSNIIKNQSTNARNAATSQFISLKKVISTQLSEARQLVASKMISIANVVNTQSSNARNNATRHFISLRKVIQTQMSAAYSSVSSYMGKIASATNRTLHTKVNVTKSVKTVDAGKSSSLAALSASAFNSLNAMALSGSGLTYATAAGTSSGVGISGAYNGNSNNVLYFELPTYLDGKVVAKTTAKYMNNELTILDKKNSRKRGNK